MQLKKEVLILTQYFPPEVGAPQNRLYELAIYMSNNGFNVTILTAMPNYPHMKIHEKYKSKWMVREDMDGLKVIRSWIYVSKNKSVISRLLNYFSFVLSSMLVGVGLSRKYDYLLCESPPLFLGASSIFLSWLKRAKLIFNVSDLWPESAEKLGIVSNKLLLNLSSYLEEYIYRKSDYISGQTQGIVNNIKLRFPQKKLFWLRNGVKLDSYYSSDELSNNWRKEIGVAEDDFLLMYGGIIGHAQGLEVILKSADLLRNKTKIKFAIVGEGPEKKMLQQLKEKLKLDNVIFIEGQMKPKMFNILQSIDASIVPLRKIDLFKGAIPSKVFESFASRKPVLLGVDGEAKDLFVTQGKCALYFEPEDEKALATEIVRLHDDPSLRKCLGENGYNYVAVNFDRNRIAAEFINFISG